MISRTELTSDFTEGGVVRKFTLGETDDIQSLDVPAHTIIRSHNHDDQWEVWVWVHKKSVYVCGKDDFHCLVNNTDEPLKIMAIKGKSDYSRNDLAKFFDSLGFSVYYGSLIAG